MILVWNIQKLTKIDPETQIGLILGTGTNAAYFEKIDQIPKSTNGPILLMKWL
jgi:hexokinase